MSPSVAQNCTCGLMWGTADIKIKLPSPARAAKPYGLLGTGRRGGGGGEGVWRWGEREIIYLSLHCHHQNDLCIKMGNDESHFNVSVGSDGQSHKTVSTNHNLFEREESQSGIEPRSFRLPA